MTHELSISKNGRGFSANGRPFFWLGDTAWLMFQKLSFEETRVYLTNRAAKGFTVIQATLVHVHGMANKQGSPALLSDDFATPNPDSAEGAFWPHVRRVVELADSLGLYMALLPSWGGLVKDGSLSLEKAGPYAEFLAEQFCGYKNVLWLVGGDVRGSDAPEVFDRIGETLRVRCPHQLIGFHPFGRCTSSSWFHDRAWLDFNMFQSGHRDYTQRRLNAWDDAVEDDEWVGEDSYQYVLRDRAKTPAKPTLDGEPSYELIPHGLHDPSLPYWQAHDVRRYAYWALLSGAAGHTYGDNAVMQFYGGVGRPAFGAVQHWNVALHNPGAAQMGHARRLMEVIGWETGEPCPELVAGGQGERYFHVQALRTQKAACLYLYEGQNVTVNLKALPVRCMAVWWFDPVTGVASYAGSARAEGEAAFTPPERRLGQNDWLLVFADEGIDMRCAAWKER